jgi:hypothetical protein
MQPPKQKLALHPQHRIHNLVSADYCRFIRCICDQREIETFDSELMT